MRIKGLTRRVSQEIRSLLFLFGSESGDPGDPYPSESGTGLS